MQREGPVFISGIHRRVTKEKTDFHEGGPRRTRKGKKISTKGHEGPRRGTKGLEETQEGSAKGREGDPPRNSKGLEKTRKGPVKGHEEGH